MAIPNFKTFHEYYEAIDFSHRSVIPNFDIFTTEAMEPSSKRYMNPYRQGFYQIGFINNYGKTKLRLNTEIIRVESFPLFFVVPGQLISWIRDKEMAGFFLMFKNEFLDKSFSNLLHDFPFLNRSGNTSLILTQKEYNSLQFDFQRMYSVSKNPHPYQEKMLAGMLGSLLYYCKAIYDRNKGSESHHLSRSQMIVNRFELMVDTMHVNTKNVAVYAEKLNISPKYLTTTVKKITGKSAKEVINAKLLLESKSLLKYSELDVSEISYRLNFQEPTHFSRFFKKHIGKTPKQFRNSYVLES